MISRTRSSLLDEKSCWTELRIKSQLRITMKVLEERRKWHCLIFSCSQQSMENSCLMKIFEKKSTLSCLRWTTKPALVNCKQAIISVELFFIIRVTILQTVHLHLRFTTSESMRKFNKNASTRFGMSSVTICLNRLTWSLLTFFNCFDETIEMFPILQTVKWAEIFRTGDKRNAETLPFSSFVWKKSHWRNKHQWVLSVCWPLIVTNKIFVSDGKLVPKDANLIIAPYFMARDPEIFENPLEFIPERFDVETTAEKTNPYAYIPFSAGEFSH